MSEKGKGNLVI